MHKINQFVIISKEGILNIFLFIVRETKRAERERDPQVNRLNPNCEFDSKPHTLLYARKHSHFEPPPRSVLSDLWYHLKLYAHQHSIIYLNP